MKVIYPASQIKRIRATKSQMDERRVELYRIVKRMHPMSVRQVYYQATVHGTVEKTESGYNKIQTDLVAMRRSGELPTFIYHLGDFDPSGVNAGEKIEQTLRELAPKADIAFQRIAVTSAQIEAWRLPTRPTKTSDTRSKGFGDISVELDAIEPDRLRTLVREAIEVHLPPDQLNVLKIAEQSERDILSAWVGTQR
jgi:hypothetical protein